MNLSASSGSTISGLFVFCDSSHFCSSAATACSVSPAFPACAQPAPANETTLSKQLAMILFILCPPWTTVNSQTEFCGWAQFNALNQRMSNNRQVEAVHE